MVHTVLFCISPYLPAQAPTGRRELCRNFCHPTKHGRPERAGSTLSVSSLIIARLLLRLKAHLIPVTGWQGVRA